MGNWCEWISNLYKVKLFSYYRPAAANGKWKAALVIVYLSQVTTAINTCMQIVHQLECVHLFVPCGNEPGQKSFRHLQMHFFRSNGGIRKTKKSSMSLHSFMQSRRSRARRRIWQRGSSAAAASSTLVPLIYTLSTASVAASPWNITRKAYKETVRKIRSVCLILDVLTRFCSCQCLESNELLEVRTSGVFLDWECNRWSPSDTEVVICVIVLYDDWSHKT